MVGHITHYRVDFDNNPRGIFLDGQTLSGVLTIFNREHKQVNRILLVVIGRGRVRNQSTETHSYYNFLRQDIVLADFIGGHLLEPGDYKYNFSYNLRPNTAPSYYGKLGFVHYELVISLMDQHRVDGRYAEMQYKHPFIVIRSMKTMKFKEPTKLKPLEETQAISVCYCCCTMSKPFDITIQFPRRAFYPGDWLYFHVIANSDLETGVQFIKTKLMKTIKYAHINRLETATEEIKLAKVRTEYTEIGSGKDFMVGLKLPLTQATNENSLPDIITITYNLKVEIELLTFCDDPARFDFDVPIHVQDLNLFTYDYCTHKKKIEVITTQPLSSSNWNYAPIQQPGIYQPPHPGWTPPTSSLQGPGTVFPVEPSLPKIGFGNVLRGDSKAKYMPSFTPAQNPVSTPYPPYPAYQSTPMYPNPISSFPAMSPQGVGSYVPSSSTIHTSQKTSGQPYSSQAPPDLPVNFPAAASSAQIPSPVATTAIPESYSPTPIDFKPLTSHTQNLPEMKQLPQQSSVGGEYTSAFSSTFPSDITYPPSTSTRYSPVRFGDSVLPEQSNSMASAPVLREESPQPIISESQPPKPTSEAIEAYTPLLSANSAIGSIGKSDGTSIDNTDTSQDEGEQLTQEQNLKKGRTKMVGERKKKFQR